MMPILLILQGLLVGMMANPVNGAAELHQGASPVNMTFFVHTLNQVVSSQSCPVQQYHTEIREYIQNLTEMLHSKLQRLESARENTSVCEDGAFFFGDPDMRSGSCYRFDLFLLNWTEARIYCQRKGYDLASIETRRENEFIIGTMPPKTNPVIAGRLTEDEWPGFWTSASEDREEGTWVWKATGEPMTYTFWYPREPNDHGKKQDHMLIMVGTGRWADMAGNRLVYPLCERKVLLSC